MIKTIKNFFYNRNRRKKINQAISRAQEKGLPYVVELGFYDVDGTWCHYFTSTDSPEAGTLWWCESREVAIRAEEIRVKYFEKMNEKEKS